MLDQSRNVLIRRSRNVLIRRVRPKQKCPDPPKQKCPDSPKRKSPFFRTIEHFQSNLMYGIYQEKPPLSPHQDAKTINSVVDKLLSNHKTGHKPATTHPWRCWNPDYLSSTRGK